MEEEVGKVQSDTLGEAYFDRNQAAQLLARLAERCGWEVGLRIDLNEPDWPILMVVLPNGKQMSWHLPKDEVIGKWKVFEDEWDGHDLDEKRQRMAGAINLFGLLSIPWRE